MLFAKLSTDKTIVFGPVLDSTGAAVTSEVVASVKIMKNGASAAALDAAATLTHSATGIYLLLLKAADISAVGEVTVVLNSGTNSASAVRLNVLPATVYDAIVTNAVNATGGLVGATAAITTMAGVIATATNITAINGNITGNLSGSVGSVTGAVGSVTGAVGSVTGAVGSVTGAVGSVTGAVGSVTGAVTVGTINANVVNASALATDAVAEIADGIWDEATSGHTTAGTYGGRIVRATNSNVEVQITGSNHIAADVHAFQTDVIDSAAIAASAVTEIQSGLATSANLLIVSDGVGYITSVLLGTISDAGTAGETYVITFGGATYTSDFSGLDATGNRTGVTRTKV